MPEADVNNVAILVAAIVTMAIGAVWYSSILFGKSWMKLMGKKAEELGGANTGYLVAGLGALVQAYILAHFVDYTGATTFSEGATTGFWLWLGFVAVTMAINIVFEGRNWRLWQINAGYFLAALMVTGGLLAAWV